VRRQERSAIVTMALCAPFLVIVALLVFTARNESARRDTESRVLYDYGAIAAAQLAREAESALHREATVTTRPAMHGGPGSAHARHFEQPVAPSVLLAPRSDADTCAVAMFARTAFRLELPSRRFVVAGAPYDSPVASRVAARVAAAAGEPNLEPHRIIVDSVGGTLRAFALMIVRDSVRNRQVVYGVETTTAAIAQVIRDILARHDVVPSAVIKAPYSPRDLHVEVRAGSGRLLWRNGDADVMARAGIDSVADHMGGLEVAVSAGPALAAALLVGRPSPLYVPALIGILLLSAVLPLLALQQLRRNAEVARLRTHFVANVSHELRTPLSQISMFAEMLALGRSRSSDERRHFAQVIHREARRLSVLAESVLRFSRSQAGPTALRFERVDLGVELRDAAAFFAPTARAAEVTLQVDTDAGLWVDADPGALRQVLLNLLDNAVKYGPRGQVVTAAARQGIAQALITIADEGTGVPPEQRERVFEAYVRLERPDAPNVAGTGIGLAVVHDLVTAHRGTVTLQDQASGRPGTVVCVALPRSSTQGRRGHTEPSEAPAELLPS